MTTLLALLSALSVLAFPWGVWPAQAASTAAAPRMVSIAAGADHTCALAESGAVWCWGENGSGELGVGTVGADSVVPRRVLGLPGDVVSVTAGSYHACAVTQAGRMLCWGANWAGQLGNGTRRLSAVPVAVAGLQGAVSQASAGSLHTCAVTVSQAVKCWGANGLGQLRTGNRNDSLVPVQVRGLGANQASVAAGRDHACARTQAGRVRCWGSNWYGELGNDSPQLDSTVPVQVAQLASGVTRISAGAYFSCAVTAGGPVKCWGSNGSGQLGDGTNADSAVPRMVHDLAPGGETISAGVASTCAIAVGGGAFCWGSGVGGLLGTGLREDSWVPRSVVGRGAGTASVSAGTKHACAVTTDGAGWCWGLNDSGQLGNPTHPHSALTPQPVVFGS